MIPAPWTGVARLASAVIASVDRVSSAATTTGAAVVPRVGVAHVLRQPQVAWVLGLSMLARLPLAAIALLLLLRVTDAGANYAQAGAVGGCFGAAHGIGQPLLARLVDRRGQPAVLVTAGIVAGLFYAALALIPSETPLAVWFLLAAAAGAVQPPITGAVRALWPVMLATEDERHVAYAVDASAFETVFTVGPLLLVGLIATLAGTSAGLLAGAALVTIGSIGVGRSRPSRAWRPSARSGERHLLGPLRSPAVRTLLVVSLGLGGLFGAVEVSLAAYGQARGGPALIGVLLALWSAGSVAGGLLIARLPASPQPSRRLLRLMATLAATDALLGLLQSPWALGVMLVVSGIWVAPIYATASTLIHALAPAGMLTETFGWTVTATTLGMTIASPIGGHLIDAFSPSVALGCSALPVLVAGAVVFARRARIQLSAAPDHGPARPA